jgi:glycine reductase
VGLAIEEHGAQVLIAGPAFQSGRYGISCAAAVEAACNADLPAVVAMHPENPGVGLCPGLVPVVIAGENAADMVPTLQRVAPIALRIGAGERLDQTARRDCIRRNIRRNIFAPRSAAVRAVEMMLARLAGEAYESEIAPPPFPAITPAPPVADSGRANIALITTGGVVPRGNPDRLEGSAATKWLSYSVSGRPSLPAEEFECIHAGIDSAYLNDDPNRLVPLDVCRELESEALIGSLCSTYRVTVGNLTPVAVAEQFGIEMASPRRVVKRRQSASVTWSPAR